MEIKKNPFHSQQSLKTIIKSNGKKYTVRNNRQRFFFPDEWKAFYSQIKKEKKITFETLLQTGARIMEAQNIKVSDIDFIRGNIVLRITKRLVKRTGTGKKGIAHMRVITISSQFLKFLRKTINKYKLRESDYLPILSNQAANQLMKRALQRAGIPDYKMFSIHNIRKTSEMYYLALGISWEKVLKQFGHSSAISLKYYLSSDIFSMDEKREIKELMGNLKEKMMGGFLYQ